jgi:hypothetical protein
MTNDAASRQPGWPEAALDVVIALLLPKVGSVILGLVIPPGAPLAAVGMTLVLLAFFLVGKVRGREGLAPHLARVVGILSAITLILSREPLGVTLLGLLALAGAAALGGWAGSRRT